MCSRKYIGWKRLFAAVLVRCGATSYITSIYSSAIRRADFGSYKQAVTLGTFQYFSLGDLVGSPLHEAFLQRYVSCWVQFPVPTLTTQGAPRVRVCVKSEECVDVTWRDNLEHHASCSVSVGRQEQARPRWLGCRYTAAETVVHTRT